MQFMLMPSMGTGAYRDPFRPKYLYYMTGAQASNKYAQQPEYFAIDNMGTLQLLNLTTAALLNGDLLLFPENLDTELTIVDDILPLFKAQLEIRAIDTQWVVAGMTYRTVARRLCMGFYGVANKMKVAGESLFAIPYDAPMNTYSSTALAAWQNACDDCLLDRSTVVLTDTLGEAMAKVIPSVDNTVFYWGMFSV